MNSCEFRNSRFILKRTFDDATQASVALARDTKRNRDVILKITYAHVSKNASVGVCDDGFNNARREVCIIKNLNHRNIIEYLGKFSTRNYYTIMTKYHGGGILLDIVKLYPQSKLPTSVAKSYFKQLTSAVKYIHRLNIVHGDIKLENIVLTENLLRIKLIDWGYAVHKSPGSKMSKKCGSPHYVAPEIITGKLCDEKVDIWSMAVTLAAMLTGILIFNAISIIDVFDNIKNVRTLPMRIDPLPYNIIMACLKYNSKDRPSAKEIRSHKWLSSKGTTWFDVDSNQKGAACVSTSKGESSKHIGYSGSLSKGMKRTRLIIKRRSRTPALSRRMLPMIKE